MRVYLVLLVTLIASCASAGELQYDIPPATCHDLSGTYAYPGIPDYRADCATLWLGRDDMPLPGPGGFYLSGKEPALFQVTQEDCALVTLHFTAQSGPDLPMAYTMNLKSKRGKRSVEWTETGFHYSEQYVPAGMRWPGQNEWMEIDLARLPDGALRYQMVQRPSRNGRAKGEIDCTWHGAEPDQGTWFTVNVAELAYLASKAIRHEPQQQPEPQEPIAVTAPSTVAERLGHQIPLEVIVSDRGAIAQARVLGEQYHLVDEALRSALSAFLAQVTFTPGIAFGEPVSVYHRLVVTVTASSEPD